MGKGEIVELNSWKKVRYEKKLMVDKPKAASMVQRGALSAVTGSPDEISTIPYLTTNVLKSNMTQKSGGVLATSTSTMGGCDGQHVLCSHKAAIPPDEYEITVYGVTTYTTFLIIGESHQDNFVADIF